MNDTMRVLLIIFFLTILNFILPWASLIIYVIWPIPIVYMVLKHSIRRAALIIIIAALINGLILGAVMGLYSVIGFGLIGFLVGSALKEDFSPLQTILLAIFAVLTSNLIISGMYTYLFGFDFNQLLQELLRTFEDNAQLSTYLPLIKQQIFLLKRIFPAILVITSIISGILIYYVTLWFINRQKPSKEVFLPVKYWHFPALVLSLGIVICILFKNNIYFFNGLIILLFLAFLQGFAVGLYYLSRIRNSWILIFLYIITTIIFNYLSFILLTLLGLIDMWFNLRRIEEKE